MPDRVRIHAEPRASLVPAALRPGSIRTDPAPPHPAPPRTSATARRRNRVIRTPTATTTLLAPVLTAAFAATLLVGVAAPAHGFAELHLDEITIEIADYTDTRVAALQALPTRTKVEKKELKRLVKLQKKLGKSAKRLKDDVKELFLSVKTGGKLGDARVNMQPSLDDGFARAELALGERAEWVQDHLPRVPAGKKQDKVLKQVDLYEAARAGADVAFDDAERVKFLVKAEKAISKALKKAEKAILKAGGSLPPLRLRSGDSVGAGGALVAIPRDADSPLAGASVLIPSGAITGLPREITLTEGSSFIDGRDTSVGTPMAVLPADLTFNVRPTVRMPFVLPAGADLDRLAVFRQSSGNVTADLEVSLPTAGLVGIDVPGFGVFEPGIFAPPLDAPSGTYHVLFFNVLSLLEDNDDTRDDNGLVVSVIDQDFRFNADLTGNASPTTAPILNRTFLRAASPLPHHVDVATSSPQRNGPFTWTQSEPNRFQMEYDISTLQTSIGLEAVVSHDGDVIAFTGRGSNQDVNGVAASYDLIGVGVRGTSGAEAADLVGRWAAVELGTRLVDTQTEPFTTRYTDALRFFDVDASGNVTYSADGTRFETDLTYNTNQGAALHTRTAQDLVDDGSERLFVSGDGRVQTAFNASNPASLQRIGWIQPTRGVMITYGFDADASSLALSVAVRQASPAPAQTFAGTYPFVHMDVGTSVESPEENTSAHVITSGTGVFEAPTPSTASITLDDAQRATARLTSNTPISSIFWEGTLTETIFPGGTTPFPLDLDTAGNHRPTNAERVLGVSTDGSVLIGTLAREAGSESRGILIGVK